MALKAADFSKVKDNTSALCNNMSNKILALKIDPILLHYTVYLLSCFSMSYDLMCKEFHPEGIHYANFLYEFDQRKVFLFTAELRATFYSL